MEPNSENIMNPEGDKLFNTIITSFSKVRDQTTQKIKPAEYSDASMTILPVYDILFTGMIAKTLKKDLTNSCGCLKKSYTEDSNTRDTIEKVVIEDLKKLGIKKVKKDCGISGLLWMNRALNFIISFLKNCFLSEEFTDTKQSATAAYTQALKPYHGMMVSSLVRMAFQFCPSEDKLIKLLGYNDLSTVKDRISSLSSLVSPMIEETIAILEKHGCNFPDIV